MTLRQALKYALILLYLTFSCCYARVDRNSNAYNILGVPPDASQDDIRRQYRKLCLKYHPDKNVHMAPKARQRCEDMFKKVQEANAQIGDEASRKQYDMMSSYSSPFGGSSTAGGMDADAFFRSYPNTPRQNVNRTPFYVNGIDISQLFSSNNFSTPWNPQPMRSIYIQKVQVPLQDLYAGRQNVEFVLRDNVWKRYRAASRGGVATSVFYQAAVFAIPLLRISLPVAMVVGAALFHTNMPRPVKLIYDVNIQRGWKGGTKLTFKDTEPGFDVVFVLEEQKHGRYTRVGNDLHTSITIRKKQAQQGCTVDIEPLGEYEAPITIYLKPNQIKTSGQQVTIEGRGWPQRKGGTSRGDLVVTVNVRNSTLGRRHAKGQRTV